ncbi:hypothetical protein M3Y94_00048400 [Aphelenchoides besseyi]|nr:hypothetical protein M3Y94_00048400 [Aphelenchoides besseyi]
MFGRSRNGLIYLILTLAIVTTILYFQDDTATKADEIFKRYSRLIANQTSGLDVRISEIDISPQSTAETYAELPLILFWTDRYYSKPQYNVAKFAFSLQCEWKCRYTNDKSKWNESHSVVIREQFPSGEYPAKASAEQRVMILLPEAPGREPVQRGLAKIPKNYMNMTVGYMRSMDIFKPYDAMIKQKTTTKQWEEIVKRLQSKSKGAFIVYSHCNADSEREKYIAELQKVFSSGYLWQMRRWSLRQEVYGTEHKRLPLLHRFRKQHLRRLYNRKVLSQHQKTHLTVGFE